MTHNALTGFVAASMLASAPCWAGLPVAYDAELKAFEKRVRGGDPLGFSLYGTADCSGTPVYSQILGAGRGARAASGRGAGRTVAAHATAPWGVSQKGFPELTLRCERV